MEDSRPPVTSTAALSAQGPRKPGLSFATTIAAAVAPACFGARHRSAPDLRGNYGSVNTSITDRCYVVTPIRVTR